jgi:hypothetical protein
MLAKVKLQKLGKKGKRVEKDREPGIGSRPDLALISSAGTNAAALIGAGKEAQIDADSRPTCSSEKNGLSGEGGVCPGRFPIPDSRFPAP